MNSRDLFNRRKKFLSENITLLFKILNGGDRLFLDKTKVVPSNKDTLCANNANFTNLLESLKNATEHEFLLVCHCVVESGHYTLFHDMLDQHLVDCESLELLSNQAVIAKFPIILRTLRQKLFNSDQSCNSLLIVEYEFLCRHRSTILRLLRAESLLLDLLECAAVLTTKQIKLILSSSLQCSDALVNYLTSQQITTYALHRFCHGLLLTGQFRLYSIMRGIVDPKRLELFFGEYAPLLLENDENCNVEQQYFEHEKQKRKEMHKFGDWQQKKKISSIKSEEDDVPLPDGILTNLCVDTTDSASARDFYETNKHEVYKNFSSPKGLAMIINNCNFQHHSQRKGTAVDVCNLTNLLIQLGYHVLPPFEDLSAEQIRENSQQFARCPDHELMHSCVVVVLSHGEYDSIIGVDGELLSTFEFFSIFNAKNAPLLAGKPRIFIMQACRGVLHDTGIERLTNVDEPDTGQWRWKTQKTSKTLWVNNASDTRHSLSFINYNNDNYAEYGCSNNNDIGRALSTPTSPSTKTSGSIFSRISTRLGLNTRSGMEKSTRSIRGNIISSYSAFSGSSLNEEQERKMLKQVPLKSDIPTSPLIKQQGIETIRGLRQFFPQSSSYRREPPTMSRKRIVHEPTDSDMLIAYATTPNYVSWRNSERGTWFVQAICEVFSKHAKKEDILTMFTRVNHLVASKFKSSCNGEKQIPECTNRLRRKFFFFPGWHYSEGSEC